MLNLVEINLIKPFYMRLILTKFNAVPTWLSETALPAIASQTLWIAYMPTMMIVIIFLY